MLVRERNREIFLSSLLWQQVKTSVVKNVRYGINHERYNRKIWTNSRDHYQLYGSIKKNCCNFSEIGKQKNIPPTFYLHFIFLTFFFFKSRIKIQNSCDFWKSIAPQHPRALKFSVWIISILFWGENIIVVKRTHVPYFTPYFNQKNCRQILNSVSTVMADWIRIVRCKYLEFNEIQFVFLRDIHL